MKVTEENLIEKFLEALATPKNSIVTELLSNSEKISDISD
jgi:hypothetical protein